MGRGPWAGGNRSRSSAWGAGADLSQRAVTRVPLGATHSSGPLDTAGKNNSTVNSLPAPGLLTYRVKGGMIHKMDT